MTDENNFDRPTASTVGYRNPPEKSRFKPGQSGNPQGRPKGALNLATVLERTLRERVVIVENGKRKSVSKLEAAIKQLADQALSGNPKALQLLTTLVRSTEERGIQPGAPNSNVDLRSSAVVNMNIDEATALRLAQTYVARHGGGIENSEPE